MLRLILLACRPLLEQLLRFAVRRLLPGDDLLAAPLLIISGVGCALLHHQRLHVVGLEARADVPLGDRLAEVVVVREYLRVPGRRAALLPTLGDRSARLLVVQRFALACRAVRAEDRMADLRIVGRLLFPMGARAQRHIAFGLVLRIVGGLGAVQPTTLERLVLL